MDTQDPFDITYSGDHPIQPHGFFLSAWASDVSTAGAAHASPWLTVADYVTLTLLTLGLLVSATRLSWCLVYRRFWSPVRLSTNIAEFGRVPTRKEALAQTLLGNLDHSLSEDGEPLRIAAFWRSVRVHKAAIGLILTASLAVRVTWLVQGSPIFDPIPTNVPSLAIVESAVALYSLLILACDMFTDDPAVHAQIVWHLFTLSACSLLHIYLLTFGSDLVPGSTLSSRRIDQNHLALLGLTLFLFLTTGTIRLGPEVFRERARLYNRAVTEKLKEVGEPIEPNVFGSGDSIIGSFMMASTFKMMRQVAMGEQIDLHELPVVSADMQAEPTTIALKPQVEHVESNVGPILSLVWEVTKPIWVVQVKDFCCMLIELSLAYVPHFCLQQILAILDNEGSRQSAMAYATLWILAWGTETVARLTRSYDYARCQIDRTIRAHLSFLLYRKLLTRNTFHKPGDEDKKKKDVVHSKADILNLLDSDARDVTDLPYTITRFLRIAIQLAIGCVYVWTLLGPSGLWGIAFSFVTYPLAYLLARWEYQVYESVKINADKRISLLQEALQTVTMIKMMASERFWFGRLNDVRQEGFRISAKARLISALSGLLYSIGPILVVVVAFAHYTLIAKQQLTASIAFVKTRSALTTIPQQLTDLMKELLGAKRVALFLRAPDVDYLNEPDTALDVAKEHQPLKIKGDVTWTAPDTGETIQAESQDKSFVLRDLDVRIERGQMTLIAGKYGSGKSLLLQALLGEVKLLRGSIAYAVSPVLDPWQTEQQIDWSASLEGLAYVPQVAWLQSMSIRENILFGLPMNIDRYKRVLHACALLADLEVLEDSDLTEIGERGKILSGGQKARVSLARAVYSRASTILLDDVISAVDAQTSRHILKYCFLSPLMAGRTIIIASHAVESLAPIADKALFLEDGIVAWQGTGPALLESEYMAHLKTSGSSSDMVATRTTDVNVSDAASGSQAPPQMQPLIKSPEDFEVQRAPLKTPRQVLVDEKKLKGAVDVKHWTDLLRLNGGVSFFAIYIVFTGINAVMPVINNTVLKAWTASSHPLATSQWVVLYSSVALMGMVISIIVNLVYWFGGFNAHKKLYVILLDRVLRAKMSFFTKTRAGSIVQRLSTDLRYSQTCSANVGMFAITSLDAIVCLLSITYYAGWFVPVAIAILISITWKPTQWYRSSARQTRRLMSTTYGPVNALYSETVAGVAVIRAFGAQSIFTRDMIKLTNMSETCYLFTLFHNRWLNILSSSAYMIVLATTLAVIVHSDNMTGGKAGFILGFAESITHRLVRCMELLRVFETSGVSLERIAEYRVLETEDIEPLYEDHSAGHQYADTRLASWPSAGQISVTNLSARYAHDMPDILHGVSFSSAGGQRIGIVGATGGGKSTLAKALFRFVEVSGGAIAIDGEDTSTLPLGLLRSRMGIIAQDPILLSGTLRLNLDIEGQYTDDELNEALRQVQLIDPLASCEENASETSSITAVGSIEDQPCKQAERNAVFNIFTDLDYEIESGGQNLSAGQKQLVVLARALLKQHRILVLDEATASIDSKTDGEISRVVHEEFEGVTVLIIAHRLRTIMPCSKILVMDQGRIIQQGSPMELIREEGGKFQTLCKAAGEEEYRHLQSLAEGAVAENA